MPRDITGASPGTIAAAIALTVTEPGYLVYLGFDTPLRHSTRETLTWDSETWTGALGTRVASVNEQSATVELRNTDLSASAIVLNTTLADKACQIYQLYDGDAVLLFDGFIDACPEIGNRVVLTATALASARRVPNKYIAYPVFRWLTPPGTQIKWGAQTVTLSPWQRFLQGK